jgi:hypothetical protein
MGRRCTAAVAGLTLVAGLAVGACGTPAPPSAQSAPPSAQSASASPGTEASIGASALAACDLVPDVAAAVGRDPIASPNGYSADVGERCLWVLARDPSRYVGLTVGTSANHAATIDALGPGEVVDGLGDDARWWAAARTLSVAVGDRSFQIDLQLDPADATRDLAVAIARQVLGALGAG